MSRTIGQYEIGSTLGKGMSAKVKLGRHYSTGELVALKIIDKSRPNERQMELLNREITAMKSLSHENILKLELVDMNGIYPRKCGLTRNCILLALQYAPNGELFDFLMFSGAFSETISRTYFSQLVSALEACHARGIYHRDIKPENLLLDANFQLKVADFGLSSINDPEQDPTDPLRTECGTKSYMPPEMLMHWPYHGSQADIWSSLVVLFIMLSGNPPFQLANVQDWWFKQIASNKRDRFWRAHLKSAPFFPQSAQEFIDRTLIPDPRRRPTIDDLKNDVWMQQEILSPSNLFSEMLQRKNIVDRRKDQEKQAELAKMQAQQQHQNGGAFDPFARVMRSVAAPSLPTDINYAPHSLFFSSAPATELLHTLAQKCQAISWKVEEKPDQFKLKIVSPSSSGQIEWVAQIYTSPSEGLNVVHAIRRSGDLLEFFRIIKNFLGNEQPSESLNFGGHNFGGNVEREEDDEEENNQIFDKVEDVISDEIDPL